MKIRNLLKLVRNPQFSPRESKKHGQQNSILHTARRILDMGIPEWNGLSIQTPALESLLATTLKIGEDTIYLSPYPKERSQCKNK